MKQFGEATREFYRRQGELRERQRIIDLLESIEDYPPNWDYNDEIASPEPTYQGREQVSDWYYEQGSPDPYEEEPDICSECEYTNCQCDAAWENEKDN